MPVALIVSSESSHAVRQARHGQTVRTRHVKCVESCRVDVMRRVEFGLYFLNYLL